MSDQFIQDSDGQPRPGWRRRPAARRRCRRRRSRPPGAVVPSQEVAPAPHDRLPQGPAQATVDGGNSVLVVLASVTVYTFTATPIFEARTRLLIEAENPNVITFKEVIDEDQAKADYYQTQYNILQSRTRTEDDRVAGPVGASAAQPRRRRRTSAPAARSAAPFGLVTGLFSSAPAAAADPSAGEETEAQSRAIDALLASLTVTPIRNSRWWT